MAIELQPFRNEGKAAAPSTCKRAELLWGQQRKGQTSCRVPRAKWDICAAAFVPPGSHLDQSECRQVSWQHE